MGHSLGHVWILESYILNMHIMEDYVTYTFGKIHENIFIEILQI